MFSPERMERLSAQMDAGRRRIDTARSRVGRVATAAGTVAATTGLFTPEFTGHSLLATAVATGAGLAMLPTGRAEGQQKGASIVMYLAPGASLAGVLIAERMVSGVHWGEALAVALWSAGTFWLRPSRSARHMLVPPLPPIAKPVRDLVVQEQAVDAHPAAQWWAEHAAIEGGAAPGTLLEDIERMGDSAMKAVIRAAVPGQPVPEISTRRLSALMDVPQDLITIGPVPGRGASVQLLSVGTADDALDAHTLWATRIAPLAMPGATITEIHFGRMSTAVDMTKEEV
ncbi:hypothetical protein HRW16_19665 [Streptomyces lunaelactis]|uniref:hypothetical protein n=1 Tax=Streptomyces lunaelactis TaxID=1535768 RepID=UPI00158556DD|nr:hypothetical protein [Streptomyces lunaelactis]NUK94010.1 hypothetical protein [Streptomyces lunaelactis]